jgi:hypothetical protein
MRLVLRRVSVGIEGQHHAPAGHHVEAGRALRELRDVMDRCANPEMAKADSVRPLAERAECCPAVEHRLRLAPGQGLQPVECPQRVVAEPFSLRRGDQHAGPPFGGRKPG